MNLSVKRLEPHIRNGLALIAKTKQSRDELRLSGIEGMAGMIYAVMLEGLENQDEITFALYRILGDQFMDKIHDALHTFSNEGDRCTLWNRFERDEDDVFYQLLN